MKIWILRLNGKILVQYSRLKVQNSQPEKQDKKDDNWLSSMLASLVAPVPEQQAKNIKQQLTHNKRCILMDVIDHSRKLSKRQYEKELNYTRIKRKDYYYLARYKLLFVCENEDDDLSIQGIQNILQKTVKLYQQVCLQISKSYKLPNNLSDYQLAQLQKLSDKINSIIEEEDDFQLVRKESIREECGINIENDIKQRENQLNLILEKQHSEERKFVKLQHQTAKQANKYRVKLCLLCLLLFIVVSVTLYFLIFENNSNQLI